MSGYTELGATFQPGRAYTPAAAGGASGLISGLGGLAGAAFGGPLGLIAGGLLGGLTDYGLNKASTSKAHDRSKNWATRKYQYELIALQQAGINPAYMFSKDGAKVMQNQRAVQQAPQKTNIDPIAAVLAKSQINLQQAQATQALAAAEKSRTDAAVNRAKPPVMRAEARSFDATAGLSTQKARLAQQRADFFQKNPDALKQIIEREGAPSSTAQAIVEAARGITAAITGQGEADTGDLAVMGGFGLLASAPALKQVLKHIRAGRGDKAYHEIVQNRMLRRSLMKAGIKSRGAVIALIAAIAAATGFWHYTRGHWYDLNGSEVGFVDDYDYPTEE